jgi:hypothetical protein
MIIEPSPCELLDAIKTMQDECASIVSSDKTEMADKVKKYGLSSFILSTCIKFPAILTIGMCKKIKERK